MLSYLATASKTWGSCSHFFRASTLFVFLCGLASRNTACAHRIPAGRRREREKWNYRVNEEKKTCMKEFRFFRIFLTSLKRIMLLNKTLKRWRCNTTQYSDETITTLSSVWFRLRKRAALDNTWIRAQPLSCQACYSLLKSFTPDLTISCLRVDVLRNVFHGYFP